MLVNINNSFYAVDNKCPHMGGSLFDGNLSGKNVICPRHGSIFDVTTGDLVSGGNILFFKVKPNGLKVYPVKVEGTDIFIKE